MNKVIVTYHVHDAVLQDVLYGEKISLHVRDSGVGWVHADDVYAAYSHISRIARFNNVPPGKNHSDINNSPLDAS